MLQVKTVGAIVDQYVLTHCSDLGRVCCPAGSAVGHVDAAGSVRSEMKVAASHDIDINYVTSVTKQGLVK